MHGRTRCLDKESRFILQRLSKHFSHKLSNTKYEYRKGQSPVNAIKLVVETITKVKTAERKGKGFCTMKTIDIKNPSTLQNGKI